MLTAALLLVVGVVTGTAGGVPPAAPTSAVTPAVVDQPLAPGASLSVHKQVTTPVVPPRPDIVLLVDGTRSMQPTIDNVRENLSKITDRVRAEQPDSRFAVATYGDEVDEERVFTVLQPLTFDLDAVRKGVGLLTSDRGLSSPGPAEDWINALWEVGNGAGGGTVFRDGASPVVVLVGDASSHDPSMGHTLTDGINALKNVGARVIGVDVATVLGDGLNGNGDNGNGPDQNGEDTHDPDQATKVVQATGGRLFQNIDANQVADTIAQGLTNLPTTVTHQTVSCDPALSVTLNPPNRQVTSGETAAFDETIMVANDAPQGMTLSCTVQFLLDGRTPSGEAPVDVPPGRVFRGQQIAPAGDTDGSATAGGFDVSGASGGTVGSTTGTVDGAIGGSDGDRRGGLVGGAAAGVTGGSKGCGHGAVAGLAAGVVGGPDGDRRGGLVAGALGGAISGSIGCGDGGGSGDANGGTGSGTSASGAARGGSSDGGAGGSLGGLIGGIDGGLIGGLGRAAGGAASGGGSGHGGGRDGGQTGGQHSGGQNGGDQSGGGQNGGDQSGGQTGGDPVEGQPDGGTQTGGQNSGGTENGGQNGGVAGGSSDSGDKAGRDGDGDGGEPAPEDYQQHITITVTDVTAPVVTIDNRTVEATGKNGTVIDFTATARDAVDGPLPVTCTPASGSRFRVGITKVTCTATDSSGNTGTATATFTVTPAPVPNEADLAVTATVSPVPNYTGLTTRLGFTLTNAGPRTAKNVVLTTGWPRAEGSGKRTLSALSRCTRAKPCTIAPGGRVSVTQSAVYNTPVSGEVHASVTGSPRDPRRGDNTATARIRILQPKLTVTPQVARPGDVVLARGKDFPPGRTVSLSWSVGITPAQSAVRVGPDGTFESQLLVLRKDQLGPRTLRAQAQGLDRLTKPVLIVQRSLQPPDFAGRR
ncbi:HYR domain-containing protein [Streptomyces nodosus]|uniref:HYR domain-containing protein n=1 Tax=Streptomyces nodosus TaxID=40318 RepID=UPI00380861F6